MDGAILCKDKHNIHIMDTGDYNSLEVYLEIYCRILSEYEIKLVNITGINIEDIKNDQLLINSTFEREFTS